MQHALRAYLQYRDWLLLESQSLDSRELGWVYNGSFNLVGSNDPIAPSPILEFISCNCQVSITEECCVTSRCTCHRLGMSCIPAIAMV